MKQIKKFFRWIFIFGGVRKITLCIMFALPIVSIIAYLLGGLSDFDNDDIIALSIMLIAYITSCTAIDQSILNLEHNLLSVRPHIAVNRVQDKINGLYTFAYEVINYGLGPAIIKKYSVFYDGECIGSSDDVQSLSKSMGDKMGKGNITILSLAMISKDNLFQAGQKSMLIKTSEHSTKKTDGLPYDELMGKFDFAFKYESMYGEKLEYGRQDNKD